MRNPSKAETEEIKFYLTLPMDSLLISIGQSVVQQKEGIQFSDGFLKGEGGTWMSRNMAKIKYEICVKWNFCEKIKSDGFKDNVTLITSIGDIIAGALTGVPPFVVATLLLKSGLTKLCSCS